MCVSTLFIRCRFTAVEAILFGTTTATLLVSFFVEARLNSSLEKRLPFVSVPLTSAAGCPRSSCKHGYAESFARPFRRRLFNTFLPPGVAVLDKKPCVFALFLRFGWYVLFIFLDNYPLRFLSFKSLLSYQHIINTVISFSQVSKTSGAYIIKLVFTPMHNQIVDIKDLWKNALVEVELELSKANFSTWFKDTYIAGYEDGVVKLAVPNQFVRDWIADKYHTFLLKILRNLSENVRSLEYIIAKGKQEDVIIEESKMAQPQLGGSLPMQDLYINKDDNLNPRYDFETFVVGAFNELAYAAAQQILESPGTVYNPFFVYGRTGYGKTHLIQAIGNAVKKQDETKKVYYVTSEKFSQDLVNAIQSNKVSAFKVKYRKYDVFIMDDAQFLSKKEKTQEELFHLFNELYEQGKQIVFSSDQHPNYIPNLEERLKSRFSAGMIVDISAPDSESRVAIVKAKAQAMQFPINNEVAEHIAGTIDGNVRELEGALNSVVLQSQLKNKMLSVSEVRSLLKNNIRPKKIIPVRDVVKLVAGFYHIDEENIYKKTRKKEIVKPRQLIMYILREDYAMPYPTIGNKLGGRDHTTVIHSYEKIKKDLLQDSNLEQEINQIRGLL